MHDFRKILDALLLALGWVFVLSAVLFLRAALVDTAQPINPHALPGGKVHPLLPPLHYLKIPAFFFLLTIFYAAAGWFVLTKSSSAKLWGIAGSLAYVLLCIVAIVHFKLPASSFGLGIATGIAGIIAFAWPAPPDPELPRL